MAPFDKIPTHKMDLRSKTKATKSLKKSDNTDESDHDYPGGVDVGDNNQL